MLLLVAASLLPFAAPLRAAEDGSRPSWWSLRPIVRPPVPSLPSHPGLTPIDAFVVEKLLAQGLSPSPEASRRTLIRRLYFDLVGLPPLPEEVARFEQDADPQAFEKLVDRLLASPRYGERWARHWLDVVHYGDTHGYDKDQPRPNAWTYRDYVIRAFNEDKRYSRFVQEQIAGDVLFPGQPDGLEALGFISAGPWDLIGHAEVPESKTDGKIARHLDRDDMVANTMSTFTSLTVHCAQCHDHKFDPISAEDYYSLQAVFAAVDRTNIEYYREPALNLKRSELKQRERELARRKSKLADEINEKGGQDFVELRKKIEAARKPSKNNPRPEFGYHSAIESLQETTKWVQVDLEKSESISRIVLAPCHDDFGGIGAGFGFPVRFKIEISDDPEFREARILRDQTEEDLKNPGIALQSYPASARGRFVRVTAAKLAPRVADFIFALSELEVWNTEEKNVARGKPVTALDSIESAPRWARQNLVDGIFPSAPAFGAPDLSQLEAELASLSEQLLPADLRARWQETTNQLALLQAEIAEMPKPRLAFVGAIHHGSGAFRGTGPDGGQPRPVTVLARGDVRKPGPPALPGALSAIEGLPARFDLSAGAPEGERRKALALWLTHPDHPLTWRTIVNRVWQYHFGQGLVETPNDFGRMGGLPSHPDLLDWLAAEFRDGGQSLKQLHKTIVMSATYRQTSRVTPAQEAALAVDGDNRLLWRMNRRKLEAEAIRDSVLFVSGQLQSQMYGPGFQDFVIEKPEHSPHYQYHLHDPDDARTHRRSQQQPFMTTLDCADPSMLVDKRNESLSALQALALLNNGFMVTMARHFAARLELSSSTLEDQVDRAIAIALSRPAADSERRELLAFAREHGLPNLCRLLFNLNEFSYAD